MKMDQSVINSEIVKVTLVGSLDIAGAGDIDMPFSILSGKHDKVMVDFTPVTFLASIGIRILLRSAKAIANREGTLVIVNPNENARKVLKSTEVEAVIPIVDTEAAALAALR